jgi:hypothetical protein
MASPGRLAGGIGAVAITAAMLALSVAPAPVGAAVSRGQLDDFQDASMEDWTGGAIMRNVATGGPSGVGDRFLEVTAIDGHVGTKNPAQWSGSYRTEGITAIEMDLNNFGPDPLYMRLLFTGAGRWGSAEPMELAPGSGWQHVVFGLTEADMVLVEGAAPLNSVLASVSRVVLHNDPDDPSGHGGSPDATAVLGIDNIHALPTMFLPGDANDDGVVSDADYTVWADHYGQSNATWWMGDFNGNGTVTEADYTIWADNYGATVETVPGPLALPIIAAGALGLRRRRNHRRRH